MLNRKALRLMHFCVLTSIAGLARGPLAAQNEIYSANYYEYAFNTDRVLGAVNSYRREREAGQLPLQALSLLVAAIRENPDLKVASLNIPDIVPYSEQKLAAIDKSRYESLYLTGEHLLLFLRGRYKDSFSTYERRQRLSKSNGDRSLEFDARCHREIFVAFLKETGKVKELVYDENLFDTYFWQDHWSPTNASCLVEIAIMRKRPDLVRKVILREEQSGKRESSAFASKEVTDAMFKGFYRLSYYITPEMRAQLEFFHRDLMAKTPSCKYVKDGKCYEERPSFY